MARTGIPPLYVATNCSKLRRFPNIGRIAGSPFGPKKRGLSNHAASTLLAGCCPGRLLIDTSSSLRIRATSDLGSPVIIATRDLLLRPLSLATRVAAVRTALSLTSLLSSCTVIPASNIRLISGSTTRVSATIVVSLSGSRDRGSREIGILGLLIWTTMKNTKQKSPKLRERSDWVDSAEKKCSLTLGFDQESIIT